MRQAGLNRLAKDIVDRAINDFNKYPFERCTWEERIPISIFGYVVVDKCDDINFWCVKKFFETDWFEGLCDLADKDAFAIRRKYGSNYRGKIES